MWDTVQSLALRTNRQSRPTSFVIQRNCTATGHSCTALLHWACKLGPGQRCSGLPCPSCCIQSSLPGNAIEGTDSSFSGNPEVPEQNCPVQCVQQSGYWTLKVKHPHNESSPPRHPMIELTTVKVKLFKRKHCKNVLKNNLKIVEILITSIVRNYIIVTISMLTRLLGHS